MGAWGGGMGDPSLNCHHRPTAPAFPHVPPGGGRRGGGARGPRGRFEKRNGCGGPEAAGESSGNNSPALSLLPDELELLKALV